MLKIGIDELATERQMLTGYSYIIFTNESSVLFENECQPLSGNFGKSFHGKEYRSSEREYYRKFLELVHKYILQSQPSLICVTLNKADIDTELNDFFERLFRNVINQVASVSDHELRVLNDFTSYLLTLQNICDHMSLGSMKADIQIDSDDIKKQLSDIHLTVGGKDFTGTWFVKTFYNKYRNQLFPGAPELTDSISVTSDSKSYMIQAADVFANFLLSHFFVLKGDSSSRRKEKSSLLTGVFGDISPGSELLEKITKVGHGDLELEVSGAITYRYGYQ